MTEDWTEKYRPKSLSAVKGNPSAVRELEDWARSWADGIPRKRAAVLMGAPGIGKTSSAEALANDMGWDIVEMNASDQRTGSAIREVALRGSYFNSLGTDEQYRGSREGRKKLIVLDEADNLFGNADRGALPAIGELIKTTKQPVILIVNDFYSLSKKSSAVSADTVQITFRKPNKASIAGALRTIADAENLEAADAVLETIAENAGGDMRAAVRDLESLSQGNDSICLASAEELQERIVKKDMYAVLAKIFRDGDPFGAKKILSETDTDPETAILWIDENLPYEYKEPGDLVRGYEKLARADVFLGRVHRRQYYGLWSYASDMMTAGVAVSKFSEGVSRERLRFPQYLSKMSRSRSTRALKSSLCLKIACLLHTSTKRVGADVLKPLKEMARNSLGIRVMLVKEAGLEPEELGFLLESRIDSKIVKEALQAASEPRISEKFDVQPQISVPDTANRKPQSNLFDF
ncbi:MAG: replication factor C large subunit [Candidatus Methanoplasma sp.]|jgi:replication factor C large subunit|nr:replication factor C large subunit [Candidatus Methanoplasma sp.]